MTKISKKRKKEATPTKLSPVEWKYAAFQALWTTYLHLRVWGLPDYEELMPGDKEYFRGLIAKGREALLAHVEDCKRAVLRAGLGREIRDEWIGLMGLTDFDLVKGYAKPMRDFLGRILHEMYPLLVRLDPDAIPPFALATGQERGVLPDDLITTEVALAEFQTTRATIRRKIAEGQLRDYRPAGAPTNAKLMLSRAELRRLFLREE